MDVVRFAPQGAHHLETQATCSLTENEERRCCLFYSKEADCCYCLGIVPRARLLKKSARLLHLNDNKAPPPARDSGEVIHAQN